jgi:hypothetical protein
MRVMKQTKKCLAEVFTRRLGSVSLIIRTLKSLDAFSF